MFFKSREHLIEYIENNIKFPCFLEIGDIREYKSFTQNRVFHKLLEIFNKENLHSFKDYDELRFHYKDIAGLIVYKEKKTLSKNLKCQLWAVIKKYLIDSNIISDKDRMDIITILQDKIQIEKSWSVVSKAKATLTIDTLIKDMIQAGCNSKEFNETLQKMEENSKDYNNFIKSLENMQK